jgi:hypothetical protein
LALLLRVEYAKPEARGRPRFGCAEFKGLAIIVNRIKQWADYLSVRRCEIRES